MSKYNDKIAITTGDINGIGIEITQKSLELLNLKKDEVVIITSKKHFPDMGYEIIDIPYDGEIEWGKITAKSGEFSFQCLKRACEIRPKSIVTAPVSKEALHLAGHKFNGQTEVLEHFLAHDGQRAEMLFVSNGFNVLLLTRHCPLSEVPKSITEVMITEKVGRLYEYFKLRSDYKSREPKFALCALNPHAGEGGILGSEEETVIKPAVEKLREKGVDITLPLPADTLFIQASRNYLAGEFAPYDCYIAMYHDQGLIPVKTVAGSKTVNMTIGLDIIRTSPSHGTAFDIAGMGCANPDSMSEAIKTAFNH